MIKIIYEPSGQLTYYGLIPGKIYEVFKYKRGNDGKLESIKIVLNNGEEREYHNYEHIEFIDVTKIIRCEIIDEILK